MTEKAKNQENAPQAFKPFEKLKFSARENNSGTKVKANPFKKLNTGDHPKTNDFRGKTFNIYEKSIPRMDSSDKLGNSIFF
jgi:hypothetical protein